MVKDAGWYLLQSHGPETTAQHEGGQSPGWHCAERKQLCKASPPFQKLAAICVQAVCSNLCQPLHSTLWLFSALLSSHCSLSTTPYLSSLPF